MVVVDSPLVNDDGLFVRMRSGQTRNRGTLYNVLLLLLLYFETRASYTTRQFRRIRRVYALAKNLAVSRAPAVRRRFQRSRIYEMKKKKNNSKSDTSPTRYKYCRLEKVVYTCYITHVALLGTTSCSCGYCCFNITRYVSRYTSCALIRVGRREEMRAVLLAFFFFFLFHL